LCLRLVVLAS